MQLQQNFYFRWRSRSVTIIRDYPRLKVATRGRPQTMPPTPQRKTTHIPPSPLHLSRESCWFDKKDINIITKVGSRLKFMTSIHNSPSPLARAKIELLVLCQGNLHKRDPLPDDVSGCCNIYTQIYSPNKWGSFGCAILKSAFAFQLKTETAKRDGKKIRI